MEQRKKKKIYRLGYITYFFASIARKFPKSSVFVSVATGSSSRAGLGGEVITHALLLSGRLGSSASCCVSQSGFIANS